MNIKRTIKSEIVRNLNSKKILIIYGPRQVGKTTLVQEIIQNIPNSAYFSCDEPDVLEAFTHKTSSRMKAFIGSAETIIIDEAQRIKNIGISLKLLHDTFPELTIIATGSSSFDLSNEVSEPLTGRNIPFTLYPVSFKEYADSFSIIEAKRLLEHRMIYGMYPSVITAKDPEKEIKLLTRDYLFKDILRIETIRKPIVLEKLTALLAYQVGQEVSYNEIAQKLEISRNTVMNYVRLLEQSFIIFRVSPIGNNPRNEITRFEKIYFFDTGIRNALIGEFDSMEKRMDKGQLFENFFMAERLKCYQREGKDTKQFFWRTKSGSEVDLVEKTGHEMKAFECKWSGNKINTGAWKNAFAGVSLNIVNKDNIIDFLI